ncbi:MAG: 30S ribosomal protein S12 methylthiotransferase RimO [Lachnospiraceae bacterium]|nr:30S ribosomal protein S12 methylthiotransferase RimO [Lachnospiraceae bacterium]MCR5087436.1 30S ribosomal protein S12 methylthiotransferase RimO [Lachnospiraceae bacterium]
MRVYFVSLGCDKNLVDSEVMLGILQREGHTLAEDPVDADAAVVNTCCFISDAKEESIETVLTLARERTEGKLRRLVVAGCLAQRYAAEIREMIPEVDAIVGTASYEDIAEALREKGNYESLRPLDYLPQAQERAVTAGNYVSYLKIAEGCDKRCTYCVIPYIRGPYRSFPMERLVAEAEKLAAAGTRELILVAQETTRYGIDLYGGKKLAELISRLCRIEELSWIRIEYCYPEEIDDALIQVIAAEPKVCKYLDMPIQHASDEILRRMGRRTTRADIEAIVHKLRREIPGIVLRTTLIAGFPGETEEDFAELLSFVGRMRFERLGCFAYSKEEGTPAAAMKGQVPARVKNRRKNAVMKLQKDICSAYSESLVGRTLPVLVDGYLPDEDVFTGRTGGDAPTIDGAVFFDGPMSLMSGDIVPVTITGAREYDLTGEVKDE